MADLGRVAEPSTARMVERIRMQADACRDLGSALYFSLLRRLADDVEAGGPAREVLRGQEESTIVQGGLAFRRSQGRSMPPTDSGWQRQSRHAALALPFASPWRRSARRAYSEQVGAKRQAGGRSGDTRRL